MKLALVSDLHSQSQCLGRISTILDSYRPNAIVCCGDITVGDDLEYLEKIFDIMKAKNCPGFFIWGNSDRENVKRKIFASDYNTHLKKRHFKGHDFFGLSYMEDYPNFDTSQVKDTIFITHQPPIRQSLVGKSLNAPKFHLSGHLHKPAYFKKYSSTTHIQIPTLMDGRFAIFNPDDGMVNFETI
jgi:predicted phosphodiesterase